jgi:hypothetical protein
LLCLPTAAHLHPFDYGICRVHVHVQRFLDLGGRGIRVWNENRDGDDGEQEETLNTPSSGSGSET